MAPNVMSDDTTPAPLKRRSALVEIGPNIAALGDKTIVNALAPAEMVPVYVMLLMANASAAVGFTAMPKMPAPLAVTEEFVLRLPDMVVDAATTSVVLAVAVMAPPNAPLERATVLTPERVMKELTAPVPEPATVIAPPLFVMDPAKMKPVDGKRVKSLASETIVPVKPPPLRLMDEAAAIGGDGRALNIQCSRIQSDSTTVRA